MAKSWTSFKEQHDKIRKVYETVSPPVPSDEFEALRAAVLARMDLTNSYIEGQLSGEGTLTEPAEAPPEKG